MLVVAIAVFECKEDEHHMLYVYGGAEFAALSFHEFWFSSSIVGLCLR